MDFPALNFDSCINCWWDTGLLLSHILNPSPFMSVFKLLQKVTILYSNLNYKKKIHKGNQLLSNYEVSTRVLEFLHSRNLRLVIWAWLVWIHGWRSTYAPRRSPVPFLVRLHVLVLGLSPRRGYAGSSRSMLMFLDVSISFPLSFPFLSSL